MCDDVYRRVLAWTFRHGWLTISLGAASVVVSLLMATQLKFRMVPFADRDQFAVEIYLRPDTPLERPGPSPIRFTGCCGPTTG